MYEVDPVIRLNRLRADHAAMLELARATHRISFRARGAPPDQYLVTYRCKGTVLEQGRVVIATRHAVEIFLHAQYPSAAPRFRLRTPLFHPNFRAGDPNLQICIEAKNWTPREPLDDLVLRIGNMITYSNYNPDNPLDAKAAAWAKANRHRFPIDKEPWLSPAEAQIEILGEGDPIDLDTPGRDRGGDSGPVIEIEG